MKQFFLSLKTTVWLLTGLIVLFFVGSYMMPAYRDVFGAMNELLLGQWLVGAAVRMPWQTSWFLASLALLVLLTINTIVCSIQAISGKWARRDALLRISPQIIHIGFLFILLAHLIGALSGYKTSGMVPEGAFVRLPEGRVLHLKALRLEDDGRGSVTGWRATIDLYENDNFVASGVLGPNAPLFYKGAGIYLKSFDVRQSPMALLLVTRDPGAVWALVGAICFAVGSFVLLALKWKEA